MSRPIYTKVRNPVILGLIELQAKEAKAAKKKPVEEVPESEPKKRAAKKSTRGSGGSAAKN